MASLDNFVDSESHPSLANVENVVRANPLFYKVLESIDDPTQKKEFLDLFNSYLVNSYKNDPKMRRLLKSIHLEKDVSQNLEDSEDAREKLKEMSYSSPGRDYHYHNALLGDEKKKSGLLKKIGGNVIDFGYHNFKPTLALGGAAYLKHWYTKQKELGIMGRMGKRFAGKGIKGILPGLGKTAFGETLLPIAGLVSTPLLYLTGGYFLYKTIKYFIKKRKEKGIEEKKERELEDFKNQIKDQYLMMGAPAGGLS